MKKIKLGKLDVIWWGLDISPPKNVWESFKQMLGPDTFPTWRRDLLFFDLRWWGNGRLTEEESAARSRAWRDKQLQKEIQAQEGWNKLINHLKSKYPT
jgi:hypothetical protein